MELNFLDHPNYYQIIMQALEHSERRPAVIEWDSYVDMLRQLKSIGDPDKKGLWELFVEMSAVKLDKAQVAIIIDSIEKTSWVPLRLEEVQAARKWLKALLEG